VREGRKRFLPKQRGEEKCGNRGSAWWRMSKEEGGGPAGQREARYERRERQRAPTGDVEHGGLGGGDRTCTRHNSVGSPRPVGRSSAGDGLQARWLLGWLGRKEIGPT
jgi:hypothetical protein